MMWPAAPVPSEPCRGLRRVSGHVEASWNRVTTSSKVGRREVEGTSHAQRDQQDEQRHADADSQQTVKRGAGEGQNQ